jgi:hypothetical protein
MITAYQRDRQHMSPDRISSAAFEDALSAIAEESRIQILQALWETDERPVSFSQIRAETDISDSGKFNYHLGKLQPEFVRKRDKGYELTSAGRKVIGAAVSGTYTDSDASVAPVESGDCPNCDGVLETTYESGTVTVACRSCELVVTNGLLAPPVLAGTADTSALPRLFNRLLVNDIQRMNRGFCPLCGGQVEGSLLRETSGNEASGTDGPFVELLCSACGFSTTQVAGAVALDHPAVIGFLYDHGVDIRETPLWELDWLMGKSTAVTGEDPLQIEITIDQGDKQMNVTLDETLTVISHEIV